MIFKLFSRCLKQHANPFVLEDTVTLSSISTGTVPSAEVITDLLNAFNSGKEA